MQVPGTGAQSRPATGVRTPAAAPLRPSTGLAAPPRTGVSDRLGAPGGGGGGRLVLDAAYYTAQLRARTAELRSEAASLRALAVRTDAAHAAAAGGEARFSETAAEVRRLEGELADHNLAADRMRAGVVSSQRR